MSKDSLLKEGVISEVEVTPKGFEPKPICQEREHSTIKPTWPVRSISING